MGENKGRTRLDAATRRAQIVDAAAALFEGRDPFDVTFEEIAERAGVSRALVYNYFRDKGDLVAAVYLRSLGRLNDAIGAAAQSDVVLDERIPVVVRAYLEFAESDPEAFRNLVSSESARHPEVRAARRRRHERLAAELGGSTEAHVVASAVVGLLEAATVEWLDRRDHGADRNRVAEVLVAVMKGGLEGGLPRIPQQAYGES